MALREPFQTPLGGIWRTSLDARLRLSEGPPPDTRQYVWGYGASSDTLDPELPFSEVFCDGAGPYAFVDAGGGGQRSLDRNVNPTPPTINAVQIAYGQFDLPQNLPPLALNLRGPAAARNSTCVSRTEAVPANYPVLAWRNRWNSMRFRPGVDNADAWVYVEYDYITNDLSDPQGGLPIYYILESTAFPPVTLAPIADATVGVSALVADLRTVEDDPIAPFYILPESENGAIVVNNVLQIVPFTEVFGLDGRVRFELRTRSSAPPGNYTVTVWCANASNASYSAQTFNLTVT